MKIAVRAYELRVGDVWNGKTIIRVDPPEVREGNLLVFFDDGKCASPNAQSEWLVERQIERIQQ